MRLPAGDDTVYYYITLVASKPDGRSDSTTAVLRVRSGVIPTGTAQCGPAQPHTSQDQWCHGGPEQQSAPLSAILDLCASRTLLANAVRLVWEPMLWHAGARMCWLERVERAACQSSTAPHS
jgi:hypothetical protein